MDEAETIKLAENLAWMDYHDLTDALNFHHIPSELHEIFLQKWLSEMQYRIENKNGWHRDEKEKHI